MIQGQDYYFADDGTMITIKSPMKHAMVCIVGTKNYVFTIPYKSVGTFVVVNTFKTHQYFDGVSIQDGVQKLIAESESPQALEESLIVLLEEDEKYVYKIDEMKSFKFKGFLGRHTVRMARSKMHWATVSPKKKAMSKEFRAFYGQ